MKRVWLVSGILLIVVLVACSSEEPFNLVPVKPVAVLQLVDLAADPVANEHYYVQVGGRYSRLPLPLCDAVLHLPPASWSLSDGGVVIRAAGLENVLSSLVSDGSILIVEGRWMRWNGLVGCGESAVASTVWYLDATRILSPNPLVGGGAAPSGTERVPVTVMSPTAVPEGEATATYTPQPTSAVATGTPAVALPTATRTAVSTQVGVQTPTPTATGQYSPLATPTSLTSPLATPDERLPTLSPPASPTLIPSGTLLPTFTPEPTGTPTPTADPLSTDQPTATASPTPTNTSTPTPSPTTESGSANQGDLSIDQVENGRLLAGQSQYWLLTASAGDVITITCGAASGVDLELTVNDPQGTKIAGRDYTGAGGAETIPGLTLSLSGEYQIVVEEVDGLEGDYGIVVLDSDSIAVRFTGNLSYGDSRSTTLPANTYHLWHFLGAAGDNVNIRLMPKDGSDLLFQFYGPDMGTRIEYVDVSGPGAVEEADFTLTETGFYTIWVEEWDSEASSYELELTEN